jgi:hypothetical protein
MLVIDTDSRVERDQGQLATREPALVNRWPLRVLPGQFLTCGRPAAHTAHDHFRVTAAPEPLTS